jgi:uncharacterized protein (DUF433 family)
MSSDPDKAQRTDTEMSVNWREHIVCDPGILYGKPTLKGTRLSVEFVLDLLARGWSSEAIHDNYPNLTDERILAVLAYAAESVGSGATPESQESKAGVYEKFRLPYATPFEGTPSASYTLQLMASLEALRASLRWFQHTIGEPSKVKRRDIVIAVIAGAGWCAETYRLLRLGIKAGIINRSMIETSFEDAALWDRVTCDEPDGLILKIRRIRNKYFAHWDRKVLKRFIAWQATQKETDSFYETDAGGRLLNSRYVWPWAAFAFDLVGDPRGEDNETRVGPVLKELGDIWTQTVRLVARLVAELIRRCGLTPVHIGFPET